MEKRFPAITRKIVLCIVLAEIVLSSLLISVSYYAFNRQFREQYDSSVLEVCASAREFLNPDDFAKYLSTRERDARYDEVESILQRLVDNCNLNMIYVSSVESPGYTHITYIYDPVNSTGRYSPYPLGYEEDYYEPNYNASTKRVFEEGATIVRHTIKTRSGSHITAQLPVYDSNGKIVAVIGAQQNIQDFVNSRRSFFQFVLITALIIAAVFILVFTIYFNFRFIKPILLITNETERFAIINGSPSKELLSVRNQDEIGELANSVYKMEEFISSNIKSLTQMTAETAQALASAIDAKDAYTHGHSTRVAEYSREIARRAGKSESECHDIFLAALMHDVGKIGVPGKIINKDLLCNVNHLTEHSLMLFRPILRHQHQQEKLERNQYCF